MSAAALGTIVRRADCPACGRAFSVAPPARATGVQVTPHHHRPWPSAGVCETTGAPIQTTTAP